MAETLRETEIAAPGVRFSVADERGDEIARARLYVITNDLHAEPEGYLVDVFVDEKCRGRGIARRLLTEVIAEARRRGCYKLVATSRTSRPNVHKLYASLGFVEHGKEFRIDL